MALAWTPLLDGAARAHAWRIIEDIAAALRAPPPPYDGRLEDEGLRAALTSREPGFAVFYAYLERAQPGRGWAELARAHLETALDRAPLVFEKRPYFAFGFAGTAWAAEHLREQLLDGEDLVEDIDDAVLAVVEAHEERREFAYRKGLVGYAIYALERWPRPAAKAILERVVERFAATAVRDADGVGVAWRTRPEWLMEHQQPAFPEGFFDPGVQEGNGGVLAVLRAAQAHGIAGARELADALSGWLWQRRVQGAAWAFGSHVGGVRLRPGWMAGDLGLAAAWRAAAALAGEPGDVARAEEVGRLVARHPSDDEGVVDAALADGAAGIAHCLARLGHAEAAHAWYRRALEMHRPGQGLGGFRFYSPAWQNDYIPEVPTGFIDAPGLLRGIAGVGLALLAAVTPFAPDWDRLMLLSFRAP